MSKYLKRIACIVLAVLLVAGCLSGCGGKKNTLKVFLYMNDHEKEVYGAMIEKFKEAHKDEIDDIEFQITTQSEYNTTLTTWTTAMWPT